MLGSECRKSHRASGTMLGGYNIESLIDLLDSDDANFAMEVFYRMVHQQT